MPDALWQIEGVTLRGTHRPRLAHVTCVVPRGVTLVLGPSGAGKTSLLDLLVGFARAATGRVQFCGRSRCWMPSDFGLWPHVTVREHLELVHPRPDDDARQASDALLRQLDLDSVADRRPHDLSTGQQSRLAVARALATQAEVIVLDEPFAHLGDGHARACAELLARTVHDGARSLVVATHAPAWLDGLATARVHLDDGRLVPGAAAAVLRSLSSLLVLGLVLLAACARADAPTPTLRTFALPAATAAGEPARAPAPRAVAAGPHDTWLVLDDAGRVLVFGADGRVQREWQMPASTVGNPEGICALADGRIAVADTHYHRVVFFTANGAVHSMIGTLGDGPGQFRYPVSVLQDDRGALYVAEYGGNDRVQKFTAGGEFVRAFGRFGSGADQLQRPAGLACHGDRLYVADAMNGRVQVFTLDGAHVTGVPARADLACPYDVATTPAGDLLVVEYGGGCLTLLAPDGTRRVCYGKPGRGLGELATPWSVAVRGGRALVADTGNRRLVEVQL